MDAYRQYRRSVGGIQAKRNGEAFERMIEASLVWYEINGLAAVEKNHEPIKQLTKTSGKGQFIACYTKKSRPDYEGTLRGGRSVVFEAKHTEDDRIAKNRVTEDQTERLRARYDMGAEVFVLVSFGHERFYAIPWIAWEAMEDELGHKHMKERECEPYRVPCKNGVIRFLDWLPDVGCVDDDDTEWLNTNDPVGRATRGDTCVGVQITRVPYKTPHQDHHRGPERQIQRQ